MTRWETGAKNGASWGQQFGARFGVGGFWVLRLGWGLRRGQGLGAVLSRVARKGILHGVQEKEMTIARVC